MGATTAQRRTRSRIGTLAAGLVLVAATAGLAGSASATTPSFVITSPSPLPEGVVGQPYYPNNPVTLTTANGTGPVQWGPAVLPNGLQLSKAGVLSGTPTTAGLTYVTVTATDSSVPARTTSAQLAVEVRNVADTAITTPSLPAGTVGGVYTAQLAASGGVPPYFWEAVSGSLPAGVSLDNVHGLLSGVPTHLGPWTVELCAIDSSLPNAQNACETYSGTVTGALAFAVGATLPAGTVGVPYAGAVTTSGGTPPVTFAQTAGALPPGVTLDPVTGNLAGTPTAAGTYHFSVLATDATLPTHEQATGQFTVVVNPAPLTVLNAGTPLPGGVVGVPYSAAVHASGGTTPYQWSVTTGSVPAGLTLHPDGTITGTPTTAGTSTFTVQVTDSSTPLLTATASESITIAAGPRITTTALPDAAIGQLYATALDVVGGTAPYTWAVTAGALPHGLALGTAGGVEVITGTPTGPPGTASFTVTVTDAATPAGSDAHAFTLHVLPAGLHISTTGTLPQGTVGTAYTTMLSASGGTAPDSWAVTTGSVPPGLTLNPDGTISGTPTTAGTYPFSVTVTDTTTPTAQTATAAESITINPTGVIVTPPVVTTVNPLTVVTGTSASNGLPNGTVGVAYAAALNASGGTPPYSWTVTTGSLPPGLTLAGVGTIAGTPTTAGTYPFTVTVTDSAGGHASQAESITINPGVALKAGGGSGGGANGYRLVATDGGVFDFGGASYLGSLPGLAVHVSDIVAVQNTPGGGGYWLLGADGGVFAFGNAPYLGAVDGVALNERLVGMSAMPGGQGYRLVGADGGVFDFGTADYQGSLPGSGIHVADVVGIASTPSGQGYWIVTADGGVFSFGDAGYHGSLPGLGVSVNDIVGVVATPDGGGYWLVGADGGVFSFGDAPYLGSMGGTPMAAPVAGLAATPDGGGYWLVGADGGVFAYGDAPFDGSMGGTKLNQPADGIAAALAS